MDRPTRRPRWLAAGAAWIWVLAPGAAMAQPTYDGPWGMHSMWWLFMLVFWGAVTAALVCGVRWLAMEGRTRDHESPLDIAKRRYARGEITREQFEQLERDIG